MYAKLMHRSSLSWLAAVVVAVVATVCLAVVGTPFTSAARARARVDTAAQGSPLSCGPSDFFIPCYTPEEYEVAYGVAPLLKSGITGNGETVVMPELARTPGNGYTDIRRDLAAFDSKFDLPAAKLKVTTTIAGAGAPYVATTEEVTDTEMVHAIAPGATLDVVLVASNAVSNSANFTTAITGLIRTAIAQNAAVISISGSHGETFFTRAEVARMHAALQQASDHRVTVVASSGDSGVISDKGPPKQVSLPASDPLVLGVGGTSLNANFQTGAYDGEMAWNQDTDASAGGFSRLFQRPSYQGGIPRIGATRGVPDVAANADSTAGMALTFTGGVLIPAPGTSASTPLWAAVIALADQEARIHLGFVNPAIYRIARSGGYQQAFHDVVTGDNSVMSPTSVFVGYTAGRGWDPVTGWGSPNAKILVPLLAQRAHRPAGP